MKQRTNRTLPALVVGVLLAASVFVASPVIAGASSKTASITIKNFMFSPMKLTVTPGETIKVTNKDTVTHTLTSTNGKFNTGNVAHDVTKSFKAPMKPGVYDYICSIHQYMTGEIIVKK
jgi:plastocyanin